MARSFWIVKPLINFSNIMHKHLQTTVHNISVTSTKTLRFDEIDDGLFNDYECISIDRCKQNWEHSHRNIYIRNSRKTRFLRRFQKSYFECTFFSNRVFAIMSVPISVRSPFILLYQPKHTAVPDFSRCRNVKTTKYPVTTTNFTQ